ncbi:MAG: PAS domain-containing protein [Deltaproteobacteria bacterium]|nr:PAS domain-containing protein [Deltaproteobacteria bacterium]
MASENESAPGPAGLGPRGRLKARHALAGLAMASLPVLFVALLPPSLLGNALFWALHELLLLFLVVMGGATFAVQWYAASRGLEEPRGRFVGASCLGLAALEALHLLAVPGMPGIVGATSWEHGVFWWHMARGWMAATLLLAAFLPRSSSHPLLSRGPLAAVSVLMVGILLAAEPHLVTPGSFIGPDGGGTRGRAALEVFLALLSVAGIAVHTQRFRQTGEPLYLRTAQALGMVAIGQVAYGLSQGQADLLGLAAHLYAAVSGYLIFDTLFAAAILDPYRKVAQSSRELAAANAYLEQLRGRIEGELAETIGRLAETTEREAKSRAELEAAIAAVPEAIVVLSAEGEVTRQNAMAQQLFAVGADPQGGSVLERWRTLKPRTTEGKPLAQEEHPVLRALRGETVRGQVVEIQPPGKKATWISVAAAPIRADGELTGAVAAAADVSALQELQSQLEDLLRAVSHDLRNPLQIILLQGERLQRLADGAEGREKEQRASAAVVAAARQMSVMIRDLVDAVRMESGRLRLSCQPLDLGAWLPNLLSVAGGAVDPARVKLELPADLPLCWADPTRLDRVLLNLLANALSHSPAGADVRVRASSIGGEVLLTVRDQGTGVAAEDLPHIFERFYRGHSTRSGDGLGLGLFIARLLVEAHGGRIWAESIPGQGSAFTFSLPQAQPLPAARA